MPESRRSLSYPCRLHRRIERQQVRFERDVIDEVDDAGDIARGEFDRHHGSNDLVHHVAALCAVRGNGGLLA